MLACLLALLQIPYAVSALMNATEENDGRVHCPRPDSAASSCDAPNFFTYHVCCGEQEMFCCMRLQLHVVVGIAVILVVVLVALATCFVNWMCRIRRKGHQSYDFS